MFNEFQVVGTYHNKSIKLDRDLQLSLSPFYVLRFALHYCRVNLTPRDQQNKLSRAHERFTTLFINTFLPSFKCVEVTFHKLILSIVYA